MSGHSKWSTIKRGKGVADAKRGQLFTKLGNAITVAVKTGGGGDPTSNFRLRLAIDQARKANMPAKNITRAIDRGVGKGGNEDVLEEIRYEAYGPAGVAMMIDTATDNRQRTVAAVKNALERGGGRLASPGSVGWQFDAAGMVVVETGRHSPGEVSLKLIDAGAEDIEQSNEQLFAYVAPRDLSTFVEKLASAGFSVNSTELTMRPKTVVKVEDPVRATKILRLMDALEDTDDVQRVSANFDIPDAILARVSREGSA